MTLKKRIGIASLLFFSLSGSPGALALPEREVSPTLLKVGVTAGPHASIMEEVKKELSKKGISLKIIEFNDFILPNAALDQGDLDLNSYQHQGFLEDQIQTRRYKLTSIAKTINLPLGIYSSRHTGLGSIPQNAKISIPNDPTNGGRALFLLQKAGLIELKSNPNPTVLDISKNPKNLKILELEAAQLPRTLMDVDFSVINTDWILVSGMNPKTALFTEDQDSPYVNLLVIRQGDEKRDDLKALVSVYQSKAIKNYILTQFRGAILPAW